MRIALPLHIDPAAFAGLDPTDTVETIGGATMGTTWRVLLVRPRGRGVDLAAAIAALLAGIVAEMSHWEADSCLSRFNRAAAGAWVALPPGFAHVVDAALTIARESGGAFDPAIGRVVNLYGYGPPGPQPAPSTDGVAAALGLSGYRRLDWDAGGRRLRQGGGCALDLSGIAKGYAVDAVADLLAQHGVVHALVEVGGELSGRGVQPSGEPWWVDLETPPGAAAAALRVALHGLSVATSGDYVRGAHTIDPRTGLPARGLAAVSVIHRSAMIADAWATALTVLGEEAAGVAAAQGLAVRLVSDEGEHLTPALVAMLDDGVSA